MALSDPDSIEIKDESTESETRQQLYIDHCRRALVTKRHGQVKLHLQTCGPVSWAEAKVLLLGLLELAVHADKLYEEKATNGNK